MFEKYGRIIAAQRAAQQSHRILCIRRHCHAPTQTMQPLHLVGLAVPWITAFEEAARDAHHHGRGEPIRRSPTHRAAVVELLGGRIGIFSKLNFRHRHEPGAAMPTARPMMPSSERLVSNTRPTPNFSCNPRVAACTPPLRPTSSPKMSMRGFTASSCSSVRRTAVTRLMRGPCGLASDVARRRNDCPRSGLPPCCCSSNEPSVGAGFRKHIAPDARRIGNGAAFHRRRVLPRLLGGLRNFEIPSPRARPSPAPVAAEAVRADHAPSRPRFRPRSCRSECPVPSDRRGAVPASDQGRSAARANARHRSFNQCRGARSDPRHRRRITRSPRKPSRLRGDVAARCLLPRRHRDAVAIVLDEEEQRQPLGGRQY